jgi:large subunit ribosomal protein L19
MESLVKFVQDEFVTRNENPEFSAGDTITVYYEIREGENGRSRKNISCKPSFNSKNRSK